MTASNRDTLAQEIDALDRRIERTSQEFRARGEFSEAHEGFVANLQKRQAEIRQKLDARARNGMSWELIESEFRRDYEGLFDQLLRWEQRLDVDATASKTS
jgi:hypothetical protein